MPLYLKLINLFCLENTKSASALNIDSIKTAMQKNRPGHCKKFKGVLFKKYQRKLNSFVISKQKNSPIIPISLVLKFNFFQKQTPTIIPNTIAIPKGVEELLLRTPVNRSLKFSLAEAIDELFVIVIMLLKDTWNKFTQKNIVIPSVARIA